MGRRDPKNGSHAGALGLPRFSASAYKEFFYPMEIQETFAIMNLRLAKTEHTQGWERT
jgi:hypothetical protein